MADQVSPEAIKATQAAINDVIEKMKVTRDVESLKALARQVSALGGKLRAQAEAYEAQEAAKLPAGAVSQRSVIKLKLTPGQREMVFREVGISVEEVEIEAQGTAMVMLLQSARRPEMLNGHILKAARREAAVQNARIEAEADLARLESSADPAARAQAARLRADPDFLGGLLHKKK